MKTKSPSWLPVLIAVAASTFIYESVQAQDQYRGLAAQRDPVLGNSGNGNANGNGNRNDGSSSGPSAAQIAAQKKRETAGNKILAMALSGDYRAARKAVQKMEEDNPADTGWLVGHLDSHLFEAGHKAISSGRWLDAIHEYQEGLVDWPNNAEGHLELAYSLRRQSELDDAMSAKSRLEEAAAELRSVLLFQKYLSTEWQEAYSESIKFEIETVNRMISLNDSKLAKLAATRRAQEERLQQDQTAVNNMRQGIHKYNLTVSALPVVPPSDDLDFNLSDSTHTISQSSPPLGFTDPNVVARSSVERELVEASTRKTFQTYNPSNVQAEIQGVQAALKNLNHSINSDANERKEWETRSADALRDSYALGANATLDVLAAYTQSQILAEEAELRRANDMLAGETNPNRREQLRAAFRALNDRKVELEQTKGGIEKAHDAVDILNTTQNMAYSKEQEQSKSLIDAAWEACDKFKVLPEGASQAKAIVDASYDITVQAYSVQHINDLNANAEQNLKAVDVLSKRMEMLVKLKQNAQAKDK